VKLPAIPSPMRLDHITPSLYEELRACPAKATWSAGGERGGLPAHPVELLGVAFHRVMAAAQNGELGDQVEVRKLAARSLFDQIAESLHHDAHPLVRLKFRRVRGFRTTTFFESALLSWRPWWSRCRRRQEALVGALPRCRSGAFARQTARS